MKNKTSKKVIALILSFAMVFGMIPISSTQVFAQEVTTFAEAFEEAGTSADPYQIANLTDLNNLASLVNAGVSSENLYFKQTAEITITANDAYTPIGTSYNVYFAGAYNGNEQTIDITIDNTDSTNTSSNNSVGDYQGVFGSINGATIENLTVTGTVKGDDYTGGIIGNARYSTITNCTNEATVSALTTSYGDIGGIVGRSTECTITDCTNKGNISGSTENNGDIGGIVGELSSGSDIVTDCTNTGNISGSSQIGGIVGSASNGKNYTITNCHNIDGNISGNGDVGGVLGSMYVASDASYVGLIENCSNQGGTISGGYGNNIGGVVGDIGSYKGTATLINCYNTGDVNGGSNTAGVAGYVKAMQSGTATVSNCYNTGDVSGKDYTCVDEIYPEPMIDFAECIGGVVGGTYNSSATSLAITDCYCIGDVSNTSGNKIGGVFGGTYIGSAPTATNCYYNKDIYTIDNSYGTGLTAEEMTGDNAKTNMSAFDYTSTWTVNTNSTDSNGYTYYYYPVLTSNTQTSDISYYVVAPKTYTTWTEVAEDAVAGVDYEWTTADTALTIKTEKGLAWLAKETNAGKTFSGVTITLEKDLDLTTVGVVDYALDTDGGLSNITTTNSWIPIGKNYDYTFQGIFDGNEKTITGIYINATSWYQGLFGYVEGNATIKDLTVYANITNISFYTGALIGYLGQLDLTATIENCHSNGTVNGSRFVGGLIGYARIYYADDTILITGCSNSADVTGTSNDVGGILGESSCASKADSTYNEITISYCYNTGNIESKANNAGGIVGYAETSVYADSTDNVTHTITNCYNEGNVTTATGYAGGIVGYFSDDKKGAISSVLYCYNTGVISDLYASGYVGGIVGHNEADVKYCYNTGTVSANGKYVGGIVGRHTWAYTSIVNCYNTAEVSGASYVGGIVGEMYNNYDSEISNCYNVGNVNGSSYKGGVVGGSSGKSTISNSYYNKDIYKSSNGKGTGLTTAQMTGTGDDRASVKMSGFDSSVWTFTSDSADGTTGYYPVLADNAQNPIPSVTLLAGTVSITGDEEYGSTLTATVTGSNATTFSYQWQRDGSNISGATNSTYELTSSDIDKTITVIVTAEGYVGEITDTTGTIAEATIKVTVSNGSATYTGKWINATEVTATGLDGAVCSISYSTDDTSYSSVLPTFTNVGTYTVYYKAKSANHTTATGSYTFKVTKVTDNVISDLSIDGWAYGETANTPTASSTYGDITYKYYTDQACTNETNFENVVGTVWVKAEVKGTDNYNSATATTSFKISKGTPQISTAPTANTLTYDGTAQALVTAGTTTTTGAEIIYSLDNESYSTAIPTAKAAGTYKVYYYIYGGSYYNDTAVQTIEVTIAQKAITSITTNLSDSYYFTGEAIDLSNLVIKDGETTLVLGTDYTVSYTDNTAVGKATVTVTLQGNYSGKIEKTFDIVYNENLTTDETDIFTNDLTVWSNKEITLTTQSGWTVSKTDKDFGTSITLSAEGTTTETIYVKDIDGNIFQTTVTYLIDTTAPTGEITIKENSIKQLINTITFNIFFKNTVDIKITSDDDISGVASVEYQKVDKEADFDANADWSTYTSISASANDTFIIYAKITDKAGNYTIINSDGVILYTDSQETGKFDFVKSVDDDITINVTTNGNTVKEITIGTTALTKNTHYTLGEENNSVTAITFDKDYLNTLTGGTKVFTISYYPYGIDNSNATSYSETPDDTTVTASIYNVITDSTVDTQITTYTGKAQSPSVTVDSGITVKYWNSSTNDYDLTTVPNYTNAGTYTVNYQLTADNYKTITGTIAFTINKIQLTWNSGTVKDKDYDGTNVAVVDTAPTLKGVILGDNAPQITTDKVVFAGVNVGTHTVTTTGYTVADDDNYIAPTTQPTFANASITAKQLTSTSSSDLIATIPTQNYSAENVEPTLTIKDGETELVLGTDYTVAYTDNKEVGTAKVEITLQGNYSGNLETTFDIAYAELPDDFEVSDAIENDLTIWANENVVLTTEDGYTVSKTDEDFQSSVTFDEEGEITTTVYIKDAQGNISPVEISYFLDKTAPTATVNVDTSVWDKLLETITFGIYKASDATVKATSEDQLSGVNTTEYYVSSTALTLEKLESVTDWTAYEEFTITAEDAKTFVVYVKVVDKAENVTYISSDGALFDTTAPVVSGVKNLSFYKTDLNITVTDVNLDTVTLNGETVKSTIEIKAGTEETYTIIATDLAGNSTVVNFTTYVKNVPVDDVIDNLPTVDENTTDEKKEEIKETVNNLTNELVTNTDKETAKDDKELVDTLNKLDKVFQEVNGNITVVPTTTVIDENIGEDQQAIVTEVVPQGLAIAVYGVYEIYTNSQIEFSLNIEQLESDVASLIFDVKPMVSIDGGESTVIPNDDIKSPVTFRLYLNDSFKGTSLNLEHIKEDGTSDVYENVPIQSDDIGKYAEITVSEFSNFVATEYTYEVSVDGEITEYKATETVTLTVPEKDGYEFIGFESDDVVIIDNSFEMPENDVTITTTWEEIPTEEDTDVPDTGDNSSTQTLIVLMFVSMLGIFVVGKKRLIK